MRIKARNIDEYLAALGKDQRAALERLRKAIRAAAPEAEECISYQLPAFRLDARAEATRRNTLRRPSGAEGGGGRVSRPMRGRVRLPRRQCSLVGFGATENHCAFYLMSSTTVEAHEDELRGYDTSKGTIRFRPEKPLPLALVKKLVKARIAENRRRKKKS